VAATESQPTRERPDEAPPGDRSALQLVVLFAVLICLVGLATVSRGSSHRAVVPSPTGPAPSASDDGGTVVIRNQAFGVAELDATVGVGVRFVNNESVTHVIAEGKGGQEAADARILRTRIRGGGTKVIVFREPGIYHLTCIIHRRMKMVVHVR
jgi:plastocyanin